MLKVHKYKKVWWFWDGSKKPRKRVGSYTSQVGAKKGLDDWIKNASIEKNYNQIIIDEISRISDSNDNEKSTCSDEIEGFQCSHCQEIKHNI